MTQLININFLAMTSKEIAELCDKNINHVNRDIKVMLEQLDDHYPNLDSMYKTVTYKQKVGFGERDNVMYYLNKELTLVLISGYSAEIRLKIIRRWQELEAQQQTKLPSTYIEALEQLIAAEKERERLELKNINLTTVVDDLTDWSSIIRIAKHNGVSEKVFKWRLLKAKSLELGYAIKQVPSARYDYQNLYHLNSFRACYPQFDYNLNREILK